MREVEARRREVEDQRVCVEIREKEARKMERKAEREVDRARKAMVETSKEQTGKSLGRSENEVKRLANKVKAYIGEQETRVKPSTTLRPSNSLTNMSAYLTKCQCSSSSLTESGIFNCELHRSTNKSHLILNHLSANYGPRQPFSTLQASCQDSH